MKYNELRVKSVFVEAKIDTAKKEQIPVVPYLELVAFIMGVAMELLFKKDEQTGKMVYDKVKWWQLSRLFAIVKALTDIVKRAIKVI